MFRLVQRIAVASPSNSAYSFLASRSYSSSQISGKGFADFYDQLKEDEIMTAGRAWTASDLRKKSFNDLHGLWFTLYKERNLLLTSRQRFRQKLIPMPQAEENRYLSVKRSMAAIKLVLHERKKITAFLEAEEAKAKAADTTEKST